MAATRAFSLVRTFSMAPTPSLEEGDKVSAAVDAPEALVQIKLADLPAKVQAAVARFDRDGDGYVDVMELIEHGADLDKSKEKVRGGAGSSGPRAGFSPAAAAARAPAGAARARTDLQPCRAGSLSALLIVSARLAPRPARPRRRPRHTASCSSRCCSCGSRSSAAPSPSCMA